MARSEKLKFERQSSNATKGTPYISLDIVEGDIIFGIKHTVARNCC
jgi:hypothetical protein